MIEYFKRNTDAEHTINQIEMRKDPGIEEYMGNKAAFNKMIKNIAIALNFKDDLLKNDCDQKLLFRDFSKMYDDYEELSDLKTVPIKNIYYNHEFTQDEVREIITALRTSRFIGDDESEQLIEKIKNELTSKYFEDRSVKMYIKEHNDSTRLRLNLSIIQNAIVDKKRLEFVMSYYDDKKKLTPTGRKLVISPDFIISDNGKYYVIGCFENENDDDKNLAIIRIDLMSNLKILKIKSTSLFNIPSLRQISEEKFKTCHLNMSYDEPIFVEMKITKKIKGSNDVNYTFIHDSFGDDYTVIKKEEDGDIVRVRCSKYAIVNWAVQYGDFVEVLNPPEIVERIKNKIEMLKGIYFKEEE